MRNDLSKDYFDLEEKIRRVQIKKCKENFFAGWRALASGGRADFLIGGFAQKMFELRPKSTANFQNSD